MPVRRSERQKHNQIPRKSSRKKMGLGEANTNGISTKLHKKNFPNYQVFVILWHCQCSFATYYDFLCVFISILTCIRKHVIIKMRLSFSEALDK